MDTLPKKIVLDTNFVISLKRTKHLDVLSKLRDTMLKTGMELYAPSGVLNELEDMDMQSANILRTITKIVRVERDDDFKKVQKYATSKGYIKREEVVDIEVITLALKLHKHSENTKVGIITFDEGIINTVKGLMDPKTITIFYPWKFLMSLIPLSGKSMRNLLRSTVSDVYTYFFKYRLERNRDVIELARDIAESAVMILELASTPSVIISPETIHVARKYLQNKKLEPHERALISDYIKLLDTIKDDLIKIEEAEKVQELEDCLINMTSNILMLSKNISNAEYQQLLHLTYLLTSEYRFKLLLDLLEKGIIEQALYHLDILRHYCIYYPTNISTSFLSKLHVLMSMLLLLKERYHMAAKCLEVAENLSPLDPYGKMIKLLLLTINNMDKANELLKELENEEISLFHALANIAHDLILRKQYHLAGKLLILAKNCKNLIPEILEEKAIVLLHKGSNELEDHIKRELMKNIPKDLLRDHTSKKIDKKLLGSNIYVENLHPLLREKMAVLDGPLEVHEKEILLIVFNRGLKSKLGILAPRNMKKQLSNAISIQITGGTIQKVRNSTPREKSRYNVRAVIELSPDTQITVEKAKIITI